MSVHGAFVESVDLRRLGGTSGGTDLPRDLFHRCPLAPGEKDPGSLARERSRDRAPDAPSSSVHDRDLVLEQHLRSPLPVPPESTILILGRMSWFGPDLL